jgi:hypothetical protein
MSILKRLFTAVFRSVVATTLIASGGVGEGQDREPPPYVYVLPNGRVQLNPNVYGQRVRFNDLPEAQREELLEQLRKAPTVHDAIAAYAKQFTPVLVPVAATRVRVLLVCDTDAGGGIAKGVRVNQSRMEKFFRDAFNSQILDLRTFTGDKVSPGGVLDYYRNLSSAASDTLVFYYSGHGQSPGGATNPNPEHYLAMTRGWLERSQLRNEMAKRPHQCLILLTDCCSSHTGYDPEQMRRTREKLKDLFGHFCVTSFEVPNGFDRNTVDYLFRRHEGTIDITAATPSRDQFAWNTDQIGGFFTVALVTVLRSDVNIVNRGIRQKVGVVNWQQALGKLQPLAAALSLSRDHLPPIEQFKSVLQKSPAERDRLWQWAYAFSLH